MAKINYKMIKEIKEQPQVMEKIINKHIKGSEIVFDEFKKMARDLKKIKRFIFLGCGSSFHSAVYGNLVFEEITGLNCEVDFADEFNKRNPVVETQTVVIVLSQSGETKEVIKAIKTAKQKKTFVIGITNNKKSKIAKLVDVHIDQEAGKEVAVPATKTFSSQLLILFLLALFIRQDVKRGLKIINDVKKIPALIKKSLTDEKVIKKLAIEIKNKHKFIILGHKYNYPLALEGALKLKEAANVFAEGITTVEFDHGPKALLNKVELIKIDKRILEINKKKIITPFAPEAILPIVSVIPLQLLAFNLAIQKGINVDKPQNIKKIVK
ncbi:MAG: Glutamine--fructose-6-phosphate aminotransferase (isomerizing) [Parcubacteria group bacterium ADurb.Bin316]|nr:MAG: Glutamine--fructose-6-phosphate aminotransferase (isomerizing) [Parcubacteria group bacterium ADurb.Bin316]HOZ55975.1 DUF2529 family protein [bacterium]